MFFSVSTNTEGPASLCPLRVKPIFELCGWSHLISAIVSEPSDTIHTIQRIVIHGSWLGPRKCSHLELFSLEATSTSFLYTALFLPSAIFDHTHRHFSCSHWLKSYYSPFHNSKPRGKLPCFVCVVFLFLCECRVVKGSECLTAFIEILCELVIRFNIITFLKTKITVSFDSKSI